MNETPALMTYALLLSILIISVLGFNQTRLVQSFSHYPYSEKRYNQYYRWLTNGFFHANWTHLLLNSFVLYQFGVTIEEIYKQKFGFISGGLIYLAVYFFILIGSCIPTFLHHKNNVHYSSIGASGALSGILLIYVLYYPFNLLYLFGMVPMPAIVFAVVYLGYSWWASKQAADQIDHYAHFYGSLIGLLIGLIVKSI